MIYHFDYMEGQKMMKGQPKVSVIIPIYNNETYLREGLDSILLQTVSNIQVICVDDGSTDNSVQILHEYAARDSRIQIVRQENRGAGAARNTGFLHAKGEYVYFFDSDDLCAKDLLEKTVAIAEKENADIVAFHFERFDCCEKKEERKGYHPEWLPVDTEVFSYRDCPDKILSVLNPTPWNKVYRTSFVRDNALKFEEISSSNDITFSAVSAAKAGKIAVLNERLYQYRIGHDGTISSKKSKNLMNVCIALDSVNRQTLCLPYADIIKNAIRRFEVDNYLFALKNYVCDFQDPDAEIFYNYAHERFNSREYENICMSELGYQKLFDEFCIVRANTYAELQQNRQRELVVSLTSYPARIAGLSKVLETIYMQERKADQVVLWLAEDQFPNKEKDLPVELIRHALAGRLTIKWCKDLKPHKKYIYALQEYPEAVVVTIDDDILYHRSLLEKLFWSYLKNPRAISGARTHLITIDDSKHVLKYNSWLRDVNALFEKPSMQLMCTGAGGVLYPPHLFGPELFNEEAIEKTCLFADDLWLKAMELLYDIPVVAVNPMTHLSYVPGSQEEALWRSNVDENHNDLQLKQICQWIDLHYGENTLYNKLIKPVTGDLIVGTEAICDCYTKNQQLLRMEISALNKKVAQGTASGNNTEKKAVINYPKYPVGIGKVIKGIGRAVIPKSVKPFVKKLLLRIPHKTKVKIKKVIHW